MIQSYPISVLAAFFYLAASFLLLQGWKVNTFVPHKNFRHEIDTSCNKAITEDLVILDVTTCLYGDTIASKETFLTHCGEERTFSVFINDSLQNALQRVEWTFFKNGIIVG